MLEYIMKYGYLITPRMRKEALEIGDAVAKYMHDNNIPNIMLLDRSARPTYMTLKNSWKKNYPNEKCPNIYFTNPSGYDTDKPLSELASEFNKIYTGLAKNKEAPVIVFDTCMHQGNHITPVEQTMTAAGYNNLIVGLAQPKHNKENLLNLDFTALNHSAGGGCHPFGRYDLVSKQGIKMLSQPNPATEWAHGIRKEMNAVFSGQIEDNYYQ